MAGPDLSRCAASYVFKKLAMLRDGEPYVTAEASADVSISVNHGCPHLVIDKYDFYPCHGEITFTKLIKHNCTTVEFLLGIHNTYPEDDRFTFAKVVLDGPYEDSETHFTAVVSLSADFGLYGDFVCVYQGRDFRKSDAKLYLQIAPPFIGSAYDVVKALAAPKLIENVS